MVYLLLPRNTVLLISLDSQVPWPFTCCYDKLWSSVKSLLSFLIGCLEKKENKFQQSHRHPHRLIPREWQVCKSQQCRVTGTTQTAQVGAAQGWQPHSGTGVAEFRMASQKAWRQEDCLYQIGVAKSMLHSLIWRLSGKAVPPWAGCVWKQAEHDPGSKPVSSFLLWFLPLLLLALLPWMTWECKLRREAGARTKGSYIPHHRSSAKESLQELSIILWLYE